MSPIEDKVVLVTGATGSFGKRFVKAILDKHRPKLIKLFSRDELKQFQLQSDIGQSNVKFFLGDIRDFDRIKRAMHGVDIVIHAAAMKQVIATEHNPMEAVKTNILGAENIINAAFDNQVERVIALSTDKAANPINLYGATKLASDKLFVTANGFSGPEGPKFSVVRYGNVIGSRGSVVPYFMSQRDSGVIPITDERMTRFWITLDQAVEFVLSCLNDMRGGEIFIPKIPSMKITDVAKAIAPECKTSVIGIRPGEKLHEVMITSDDAMYTVEFDHQYVIQPSSSWWDQNQYIAQTNAVPVAEDFCYRSDKNDRWLDAGSFADILATENIEL